MLLREISDEQVSPQTSQLTVGQFTNSQLTVYQPVKWKCEIK